MTKSNPSISFNNHGTLYIFKVSHNIFNIVKREGGNIKYLSLIIVTQSMVFYLSIWLYVTSEAANYKNKMSKFYRQFSIRFFAWSSDDFRKKSAKYVEQFAKNFS